MLNVTKIDILFNIDHNRFMLATVQQSAELVELFKSAGKKQIFQKNDIIISPNLVPAYVFYINTGIVKAYDVTKYNEDNLLIIRKSGEIFPLIWALTGQERQITYQSLSNNTITWKLSRDTFINEVNNRSDLLFPLLDMTLEMYRLHSERILNLEYRTVRERIISFIFTMSQRFGIKNKDGIIIELPLRHQDIASSINSSRETTTREMTNLTKKGFIDYNRNYILIKKPEELAKFIN
jgi:CRP/FNR family cyclic AMP-dependent transcriptional regulator